MSERIAVGFDFDHTLGLDNGLEVKAFYRLAHELGRPLEEGQSSWSKLIADILGRFRLAQISLDAGVSEFVTQLGGTAPPDAGERYRAIAYALVDELVTPIEGAREVIAALDGWGVPHAILTNGWSPLQTYKIARAIDYRGPVLVSDALGILKPDPAAFASLVDALGVERNAIWFVGDNPNTDIAGAQNAGLRGVWFDWEELRYPPDAPQPNYRISHLRELIDLLRGPAVSTENLAR